MLRTRYLPLLILFCVACAGPVLNIIADGPAFFVNRRATPLEIVSFVGLLVLGLPLVMALGIGIVSRISERAGSLLFVACSWALFAAALLPLLAGTLPNNGIWALALSAALGGLLAALYARWQTARTILAVFSPIAVLIPLQLVTNPDLRALVWPQNGPEQSTAALSSVNRNVVVLLFDEFALNSLMTEDGLVDAVRFPHFAKLASQSIWFRNTTSVNQFTPLAVPAILSGRFPQKQNQLPTTQQYPVNLFTLLSPTHEIRALEPFTKLCPEQICQSGAKRASFTEQLTAMALDASAIYLAYALPSDLEVGVPEIDGKWGDFWNEETADWDAPNFDRGMRFLQYRDFISRIQRNDRPTLYFMHMILPHMPLQFTAGGFSYPQGFIRLYENDRWVENPALQQIAYAQYLTQVGTADGLLGRMIAKLEELGIWDDALVVVVADHGVSFQPNTYRRGHPSHDAFYQDVMSVPFFMKLPGQREGRISERNVETIDVLPTMIEALQGQVKSLFDGRSALGGPENPEKRFFVGRIPGKRDAHSAKPDVWGNDMAGSTLTFPVPDSYPMDTIRWKHSLPGFRASPPHHRFYIGPLPELLRHTVTDLPQGKPVTAPFEIKTPRLKDGALVMRGGAGTCPCLVQGTLLSPDAKPGKVLALAINGVIESLSNTFTVDASSAVHFSFMMTERSFVPGRNVPELFEVQGDTVEKITLLKYLP